MAREHIHFVTGRLAEVSLRNVLDDLAPDAGFDYSVDVLNITVAALMNAEWIARRIAPPAEATRVMIPGYCAGDEQTIARQVGIPVLRGPRDLRQLPAHFGRKPSSEDYGRYTIEIIAEINHVPQLSLDDVLKQASALRNDGADVIDVGCDPGEPFREVGRVVESLVALGHRVSIDSLHPAEIAPAVAAGAELVLSVNATNRDAAPDWGCEVVAIPDEPGSLAGLDATVDFCQRRGVPLRIDPVLEPIGFGFARSLDRYLEVRRHWPKAAMMMGVGNLTELTDVDSAGVNVMLLGFCQELAIGSILTTQVIPWAQSSVRECDLARRLVHYAHHGHVLPKHVEPRLVMLRDGEVSEHGSDALDRLAAQIKDPNYRIFAEQGEIHVVSAGLHLADRDPFRLFEALQARTDRTLDPSHIFYLGYEMAKAATALTLGKQYQQDEALDWGFLTEPESKHRRGKADRG